MRHSGLFFFIFVLSAVNMFCKYKIMSVPGFEPGTSGLGSEHSGVGPPITSVKYNASGSTR